MVLFTLSQIVQPGSVFICAVHLRLELWSTRKDLRLELWSTLKDLTTIAGHMERSQSPVMIISGG